MRKSNEKSAVTATTGGKKNHLAAKIYKYRGFYLMFLPVLIFALIFFYLPMLGIRFAFTDYNGIKEASFVGLKKCFPCQISGRHSGIPYRLVLSNCF